MNENREHCKSIALELEAWAAGEYYRCPECGEVIRYDNGQYDEEAAEYTCQECGATFEENDLEALSLWDYFNNDLLDIEYRIGGDRTYRSVRLMVTCGGPNIYIDTAEKKVLLYWWSDYADYMLSQDVCDEIDAIFEELYICS